VTGSVDVESLDQTGAVLAQLADRHKRRNRCLHSQHGDGRRVGDAYARPVPSQTRRRGWHSKRSMKCAPCFDFSNVPAQIVISPESHLAATLATCRARRSSGRHRCWHSRPPRPTSTRLFACAVSPVDVVDASPINVTVGARVAGSSAQTYAGLIAAGLSQESASISQSLGYVPGSTLTISQLLTALDQDITNDCVFDGKDNGAPIVVQGYTLTSQALAFGRFRLGRGHSGFSAVLGEQDGPRIVGRSEPGRVHVGDAGKCTVP